MSAPSSENGSQEQTKTVVEDVVATTEPKVASNGVVLIPQPSDLPEDPLV